MVLIENALSLESRLSESLQRLLSRWHVLRCTGAVERVAKKGGRVPLLDRHWEAAAFCLRATPRHNYKTQEL